MEGKRGEDRPLQLFCYRVEIETTTTELELEDGKESEDCLPVSLASMANGFPRENCLGCWPVRQRDGVRN